MDEARPRLRPDVIVKTIDQQGGQGIRVVDPITGRAFKIDPTQARVLAALDGKRSLAEVAKEVLGDETQRQLVGAFVEKLSGLGLIETNVPSATVDQQQRVTLRAQAEGQRDRRLIENLTWAAAKIPFHRERLAGLVPSVRGFADLHQLPTMTKKDFRDNFPSRLLPDGTDMAQLIESGAATLGTSSGSGGERLEVLFDRKRDNLPHFFPGIQPIEGGWAEARIALFTTPICAGSVCHMGGMSYEERLSEGGILVLNSSDRVTRLTRSELENIVADLDRFKPNILYCDPVYGAALVLALEREKLPLPKVDVVWTCFEYCSVLHRRILMDALKVSVHTLYAASDTGGVVTAFQCERGNYHVRDGYFVVEFLRDGRAVGPNELGELVVTTLANQVNPVVRYRIGDIGRPLGFDCTCMHNYLPAFTLEGRIKDCLLDVQGELVTTRAFDELFLELDWLAFYSVTQRAPRQYEVLGMLRGEANEQQEREFLTRAHRLLGSGAEVKLKYVRDLPIESSFKYRITSSTQWTSERW